MQTLVVNGFAVQYQHMSESTSWKETVRAALSHAQKAGLALVDMDRDAGINAKRASNFLSTGYLNTDEVKAIELYLAERGYMNEEGADDGTNPKSFAANFTCPACGEETPGPSEARGKQPLHCMWCGSPLGVQCPKCGTIEWRDPILFCRGCGNALSEEALKMEASIHTITESKRERLKREDSEKEARRRTRRARGEPEI